MRFAQIRPRSILEVGIALAILAVSSGCKRSREVVRLPLPRTEWLRRGDDTRPGCWLSPGDTLAWEVPAGPARHLDGAYEGSLADSNGRVDFTVTAEEPARTIWSRTMAVSTDGSRWNRWSLDLPRLAAPARLTISFRDPTPDAVRSVFLTEPSLLVERRRSPRTIVVFLVDTLRADHVSGYGYARATTPHLDRFFDGWLRARTCLPAANWTLPSHASLFLSQSVAHHGVGRFGRLLPEGAETLAAALGRAGYRTLAVTGGGFVDPAFGFARGFDRYDVVEKPASAAVARALAALEEHRGESVFLFLHTYQVHDYQPSEAVARAMFGSLSALGPNWPASAGELATTHGADPRFPSWLRARYDAALRCVDDAFAELLEGLERSGRLADTAVLFTADHGEALCDHEWRGECLGWTHGNPYLYEEELAVPLEMRIPWRPEVRGTLQNVASLLDVAPTLVEMAGAPRPGTFEGRSLLAGEPPAERGIATEAPPLDAVAYRVGPHKIIRRTGVPQEAWFGKSRYRLLPAEECLDLARDPNERHPEACASAWGLSLRQGVDRYLVEAFPDALVVRVPAVASKELRAPFVVRARGRGAAPSLRTFGLSGSAVTLERRGFSTDVRFSSGVADVWLAFEPAPGSRALAMRLEPPDTLVWSSGRPVSSDSERWSALGWAAGHPLPTALTAFTTPPAPRFSSNAASLPNDVVSRLLSLGYLKGSPELTPGADGASVPDPGEPPPDLSVEEVRIERAH